MTDSTHSRHHVVIYKSRPSQPSASVAVSWHGPDSGYVPVHLVDTVKILCNGNLTTFDVTPGDGFAVRMMLNAMDAIMAAEQIPFGEGSND